MRTRRRARAEIWLGLLVIVSSALLTWGYFWLTGQPLGEPGYTIVMELPHSQQLDQGDRVRIAGVEIGSVTDVDLIATDRVIVRLHLRRDVRLPQDSKALIQSVGVFGDMSVDLIPGTSTTMLTKGDTIAAGTVTGLTDLAGEIGDKAESVLTQIDRLLTDNTIEDVQGTVAVLQGTIKELERLVSVNSEEFAALSRSLRQTAESLEESLGGPAVEEAVADLEETAATLAEAGESLKATAHSIESVAAKIDRGQGTLGLLVNDPSLYEELRSAVRSAGALTRDIQENPSRYMKFSVF